MSPETEQQYQNQISMLQAEIGQLRKKQTQKIQSEKYGLNWIDVPEAFEEESVNKIPILEEVKEKAIKNEDGKPTHILIEGDNYHALTCLNYTHQGKIDVIYIDPPYNTGSDGFTYKDARFLTEFPDGTAIPKDHPLRHSVWLSFMNKRLKLAKNLLSDSGVIFISIDDNEQAQLKILCDSIFGANAFLGMLSWESTTQPINSGTAKFKLQRSIEYILVYGDKDFLFKLNISEIENKYPHQGKLGKCRFEIIEKSDAGGYARSTMKFKILGQSPRKNKRWQIGETTARRLEKEGKVEIVDGIVKKAVYPEDEKDTISYEPFWSYLSAADVGTAQNGKEILNEIMAVPIGFDTVKPVKLLLNLFRHFNKKITVLDFFAGSGTTLHSIIVHNVYDNANCQCILVQSPEKTYQIKNGMEIPKKGSESAYQAGFKTINEITYERTNRVINGYTDSKGKNILGLGNSLKYYRTTFVGKNNPAVATDGDRIILAQKAGCLISLSENTLDEIETNNYYQLFTNGAKFTGVYFNGDTEKLPEFVKKVERKQLPVAVYIFSWGNPEIFENEFDDMSNITIKSIPQPILEIYKTLNGEEK